MFCPPCQYGSGCFIEWARGLEELRLTPTNATLLLFIGDEAMSIGSETVYVAIRDGVDMMFRVDCEMGIRSMVRAGDGKHGAWYCSMIRAGFEQSGETSSSPPSRRRDDLDKPSSAQAASIMPHTHQHWQPSQDTRMPLCL